MLQVYRHALPGVRQELRNWRALADRIPDEELRRQAVASMTSKEFHCIGGSVYALPCPELRGVLIRLIVALQTISDYLDNLCDRSTSLDPDDFRRLHQSMLDGVDPSGPTHDYYAFRSEKEDGGYLVRLVEACQSSIRQLPAYAVVQDDVRRLVGLYADLQVYKHIRHDQREPELLAWWEKHKPLFPELEWNEFAAATGSTLGMFMLFLAACDPSLTEEQAADIRESYFPFVCSLHILLDYLIDQEEDRIGGDLNFCSYYKDSDHAAERLGWVVLQARERVRRLPSSSFHRMIIEGLVALYLSDPKVKHQSQVRRVSKRLMKNSPLTRLFFWMNSMWIRSTS
jgi:tetraprenyl-beta-curcumene synthase